MCKTYVAPLELAPGVKTLGPAHRTARLRCQLMEKAEDDRKKHERLAHSPQEIFWEGRGLTHFPSCWRCPTRHTRSASRGIVIDDFLPTLQLVHSQAGQKIPFHTVQGSPCQMCYATRRAQQMGQGICFAAYIPFSLSSVHLSSLGFLLWFTGSFALCWLLCVLRTKPQNLHKPFPLPSVLPQVQLRQKEELEQRNTIERAPRLWKKQHHSWGTAYFPHILTFLS